MTIHGCGLAGGEADRRSRRADPAGASNSRGGLQGY